MTGVVVEGKIIEVKPSRKVNSKKMGKQLDITHAILRDKSGEITLVLRDQQIPQVKPSEEVRVEFGYINSFHNNLQLNIGYGRLIKLL